MCTSRAAGFARLACAVIAAAPAMLGLADAAQRSARQGASEQRTSPPPPAPRGPSLGAPASAAEIAAMDLSIGPDGAGLPPGSGTPKQGAEVYATKCIVCHGPEGANGVNDRLAGGQGSLTSATPVKTIGSYWPYATTVFDYVRRAMPYPSPHSLTNAEAYAVTAYLLHLNGIIGADEVMDATSLPKVKMPNRGGFSSAIESKR
ncbi:MAG: c-type cytochrome [Vicinamibacterales bacterium]